MAAAARAACSRHPGFSDATQLNATKKLAISCASPEADGRAAPCIYEPFFHFPRGFESMGAEELARHYKVVVPFVQCRLRPRDEDWPTHEAYLQRTPDVRDIRDVLKLLGHGRVTFVGASLARATLGAIACAMESRGIRRGREAQFGPWGWATFSEDNGGCRNFTAIRRSVPLQQRVQALRDAGCLRRGRKFAEMLNRTDVVIVGYNPQHYETLDDWWRLDLATMLPLLQEFATRPGKLAVLREPAAQHFAGGEYRAHALSFVSSTKGCCNPISTDSPSNYNWRATLMMRRLARKLAPDVRILPWYNVTAVRWGAHVGTRASCFSRQRAAGGGEEWARDKGCGCDCTHFCYTPLFYDSTILTPLHDMMRDAGFASTVELRGHAMDRRHLDFLATATEQLPRYRDGLPLRGPWRSLGRGRRLGEWSRGRGGGEEGGRRGVRRRQSSSRRRPGGAAHDR